MQNVMFDSTTLLLSRTLGYSLRRHKVIAANLANVETPNYKAKDLPFNAILKSAVVRGRNDRTRAPHYQEPRLVLDVTGEVRFDGNNVNNENEMIKLTKNSGLFSTASQLIKYKFSSLSTAIRPSAS